MKNLTRNQILIISGIIILAVAITVVVVTNLNTDQDSKVKLEPKTQLEKTIDSAEIYKVGDEVKYATQNVIINSVKVDNIINSYGEAYIAEKGTKYLIVNMTVTNTTKEPLSFDSFTLLSKNGELIQATTDRVAYIENSLRSEELNPRVPVTGVDVFVIPQDLHETNIGSMRGSSDKFVGTHITF